MSFLKRDGAAAVDGDEVVVVVEYGGDAVGGTVLGVDVFEGGCADGVVDAGEVVHGGVGEVGDGLEDLDRDMWAAIGGIELDRVRHRHSTGWTGLNPGVNRTACSSQRLGEGFMLRPSREPR